MFVLFTEFPKSEVCSLSRTLQQHSRLLGRLWNYRLSRRVREMQANEDLNTDIGILTCDIAHVCNRVVKLQFRGPHMISSRFCVDHEHFYEDIVVTLRRLRCVGWAYDTVIRSTMKTETYIITRLWYPLARLQVDTAQTDQSVNSVPCSHFFCYFRRGAQI